MSDVLSFYFDGTTVQAVTACTSGYSVTVRSALTFPYDELDDYLSFSKEKSCILCCNSPVYYQDIIHLPPAAVKHYDALVRTEVKKSHPELTAFTIFYRIISEATIDGKLFNKIAAFSYADESISGFISAFNRHDKVIAKIYSAPYSIFRLANMPHVGDAGPARVFIAALPGEKILLLSNRNELEFTRKIPSSGSALCIEDTGSINMTVDYCVQTLRANPLEAVMLDPSETYEELSQHISIPFRSAMLPRLANVPDNTVREYLAPLAAALHYAESSRIGDIRPADYISFSRNKKLLSTLRMVLFAMALPLAGYLVTGLLVTSDLKTRITQLRSDLSSENVEMVAYRKLDAEVNQLKEQIEFINRHNTSLDPTTALAALTLQASAKYSIKKVNIQTESGLLNVQIEGDITAADFTDSQATYESIVEQLSKIPGYLIVSSNVNIRQKTFHIQARYNGLGKQLK
jgi:hypothetical protein